MSVSSSVARYAEALPNGLRSYPGFVVKLPVIRAWLDLAGAIEPGGERRLEEALPEEVTRVGLRRAPSTTWIPEAHGVAVILAFRDLHCASDFDCEQHALRQNRRLFTSPLYRPLGRLFSPARVVRLGAAALRLTHRGIVLRVNEERAGLLRCRLTYPEALIPPVVAACYRSAIYALAEICEVEDLRVEIDDHSETSARLSVRFAPR